MNKNKMPANIMFNKKKFQKSNSHRVMKYTKRNLKSQIFVGGLKKRETEVLNLLMSLMTSRKRKCYVTKKWLAEKSEYHTRTVHLATVALEKKGFIKRFYQGWNKVDYDAKIFVSKPNLYLLTDKFISYIKSLRKYPEYLKELRKQLPSITKILCMFFPLINLNIYNNYKNITYASMKESKFVGISTKLECIYGKDDYFVAKAYELLHKNHRSSLPVRNASNKQTVTREKKLNKYVSFSKEEFYEYKERFSKLKTQDISPQKNNNSSFLSNNPSHISNILNEVNPRLLNKENFVETQKEIRKSQEQLAAQTHAKIQQHRKKEPKKEFLDFFKKLLE